MGRFTVYIVDTIPGTDVRLAFASMTQNEQKEHQALPKEKVEANYLRFIRKEDDREAQFFASLDEFWELSPGQALFCANKVNEATIQGVPDAAMRFRDGDGEAGSVQPVPDGGDVGVPAE
jgi:hypothetical protein